MTYNSNVTLDYSKEYEALQAQLVAPFKEINDQLANLKEQKESAESQLSALTTDELMTPEGVAKQANLQQLIENISTATETAKKAKDKVAEENSPMAHQLVKDFQQQAKEAALQRVETDYDEKIEALRYQLTELDAERDAFVRNTNAAFEEQAHNWLSSHYHSHTAFMKVVEGKNFSLAEFSHYWPKEA